MIAERLIGAWRLVEQTEQWDDGRLTHPRSANAHGLIVYSAGGWMSAILGRAAPRPDRDRMALDYALEDTLAYGGRFAVDEVSHTVRHQVRVCSYAGWTGTELLRQVVLPDERTLQLTGARPGGGAQRILTWQRPEEERMTVEPALVGAWLLEEYVALLPEGGVEYPMGEAPYGLLHYGPDGWMSVIISRRDRPPQHPYGSDAFAFTEFVCYYGPYSVDFMAGTVTHYTVYSSYPPMHATSLKRKLRFLSPDVITLTARNPARQVITLRWRRQPAG
ncbi:MAG: lipocalin-like domain-containing protein [Anaerolineae bacterium]|nr:lipocalin-like domain-containing protein [Anaerolineae bacterium]